MLVQRIKDRILLRGLPHQNPRISVDTKKKELVGNFKNAGQSWRQEAEEVNAHALGLRKIERCRRKANAQADN